MTPLFFNREDSRIVQKAKEGDAMIFKFDSESEYANFADNIRSNTKIMPKVFSNYKAGFYSKIYDKFLVLMYADSNTWDHIKWPLHWKFYGIKINGKEKRYLIGIIYDLWLAVLSLILFIEMISIGDMGDIFIYVGIFSLIMFLTRKERLEIKRFLFKYL